MNGQIAPLNPESKNTDDVYEYLYCMVLKSANPKTIQEEYLSIENISEDSKCYINVLKKSGLELDFKCGITNKEIFVFIKADLEKLRDIADSIDFNMLLDPQKLREKAIQGDTNHNIASFDINHMPQESTILPYEYIYASYKSPNKISEDIYYHNLEQKHPFNELTQLKLCADIMESKSKHGKNALNLDLIIRKKKVLAFYALHDRKLCKHLQKRLLSIQEFHTPINEFRV